MNVQKWTGPADDLTRVEGKYKLRAEQMQGGDTGHQKWWWGVYYADQWIGDGDAFSGSEAKRKAIRAMQKHKP